MMKATAWWNKNRITLGAIFALAGPAILEQTLQTIVMYCDTAMVGSLGAQASAAVGLTTPVSWLVCSPLWALGTGFLACIARAIGAKDENTARVAAMQSIYAVAAAGVIMTVITQAVSPFLPGWLQADPEIHADASAYFAITTLPMIFRASSVIFASTLRASGDTKTPMFVTTMMNVINVVLNFLLIFPTRQLNVLGVEFTMFGADLGVRGAAIASAVAYCFSGVMMMRAMLRSKRISPRGMKFRIDKPVMSQCIRVGIPVACTRVGVCLGQVVFLSQVSSLGTISLAAHSLALTAEEAIYLPGYGMQTAAATLSGNAVGARDEKRLLHQAKLITFIAMFLMTCTGLVMFLLPAQILSIFTPDQLVIAEGVLIMRIVAVTEPIYAAAIVLEGIFDGMGDTKTPFVVSIATMWGIRILFTFLCVTVFGLGLTAVWTCMAADNVTRAIILFICFRKGVWRKRVGMMKAA